MKNKVLNEVVGEFKDTVADQDQPLLQTDPNMTISGSLYPSGYRSATEKIKMGPEPEEKFDPKFLRSIDPKYIIKGGSRKKSLKKRRKTKRKGAGPKKKSVSIPAIPHRVSYIREGDSAWDEYADDGTYRGRVVYHGNPQLREAQLSVLNFREEAKQPISDTDSPVTIGIKNAHRNKYLNDVPPPSPDDSPIQSAIQSPIITPDDYYELAEDLKSPPKSVINMSDVNAAQRILNEERQRRKEQKPKKAVGSRRAMKMAKDGKKGGRKSLKKSKRKGGSGKTQKIPRSYTSNTQTFMYLNKSLGKKSSATPPSSPKSSESNKSDKPKESGFSMKGSVFKSVMKGWKKAQEREAREKKAKEAANKKGGKSLKNRRKN